MSNFARPPLVGEAETNRSPTQRLTDRFERIFVPAVLVLVVLLLFAGFVVEEPFSETFYRAMAVLVSASPCALAIATPSAVLSRVARAARSGVLVKGGGPAIPESLRSAVEALEADGRTTMYVRHGTRWLGALGTMDTPRERLPPA